MLTDLLILVGGFVLGFFFCALLVVAWRDESGLLPPPCASDEDLGS